MADPGDISSTIGRSLREIPWRAQPNCRMFADTGTQTAARGEPMALAESQQASITVNQDGIKSFFSAVINAQHYEIFVDDRKLGELTGYRSRYTVWLAPGPHAIYVRAYARDSVSVTRVHSYSETLNIELSPGEHRVLSCGLVPGPPLREFFVFGGLAITLLLLFVPLPAPLSLRARYGLVMAMALITLALSWYGYSSRPGANIYLKEA